MDFYDFTCYNRFQFRQSEVIAVNLYEYDPEEHHCMQERDRAILRAQIAFSQAAAMQHKAKQARAEAKQAQMNAKMAQIEVEQAQIKLAQVQMTLSVSKTIAALRSMGYDDSFICTKLREIYQISKSEARSYLTEQG